MLSTVLRVFASEAEIAPRRCSSVISSNALRRMASMRARLEEISEVFVMRYGIVTARAPNLTQTSISTRQAGFFWLEATMVVNPPDSAVTAPF